MNFFRQRYYSWLVPYVEGTLDARRRAALEARLAQDPSLAAAAEAQRRTMNRLRDAASSQAAEEASPETVSELWRRVEARIAAPRRPTPGPLVWAGSACALAGLGWAVLWGPLGHLASPHQSTPPQVAMTVTTLPNNSSPAGSAGRRHWRHPKHRIRHTSELMAKRPASVRPSGMPGQAPSLATANDDHLAKNDASPPTVADATATAAPHFQLATHVRPIGHEADSNAPVPEANGDQPSAGTDNGETTGDATTGATEPAQTAEVRFRRHHRHRRHHRRVLKSAEPTSGDSTTGQAPTSVPAETSDTPAPVRAAPPRLKPVPID